VRRDTDAGDARHEMCHSARRLFRSGTPIPTEMCDTPACDSSHIARLSCA